MKKPVYKSGILLFITLLLVAFTISAQEVAKEFHKEYNAGTNTTLNISNRYGDVLIETWDKDQVVIDVKVIVEMPGSRDRAEKLLSYIEVEFSEGENRITAETVIDSKFNFSGWGSGSKRFSIDYTVKMPVKTALDLSNRYGNTDLDELQGLVNIDIKYGNLTAGKLSRGNVKPLSKVAIAYGKGSVDETGWLDLYIRYCGNFSVSKGQAILLDSKYSKMYFGDVSSVVGESKYDNINIENINNLVLENGYTGVKIGTLTKKLQCTGSYGSFSTDRVPAGFESLEVNSRYMGIKLGISESANFKLDAKVSYGGLSYNEDNFRNQNRIIENNSKQVSGIMGNMDSPSSTVKISSSYGSVKLN